jgi:hypothetical protein
MIPVVHLYTEDKLLLINKGRTAVENGQGFCGSDRDIITGYLYD